MNLREAAHVVEVVVGEEDSLHVGDRVPGVGDAEDDPAAVPRVARVHERQRPAVVDEVRVHPGQVVPPHVFGESRDHTGPRTRTE